MEILLKDEVYQIIGASIEVHQELGNGFLEAVYQEALEIELALRDITFKSMYPLKILYKGKHLKKEYIADIVCFDSIVLELKALKSLGGNEESQIINYLKATGLRVGLLINFGSQAKLEWKRFVL